MDQEFIQNMSNEHFIFHDFTIQGFEELTQAFDLPASIVWPTLLQYQFIASNA